MKIGIVGHEAAKFTSETEARAREIIRDLCSRADWIVSGHCHLGGIDIWAEYEAASLGVPYIVFPPKTLRWSGGYKERNEAIARESDEVHCIVVAKYPEDYAGMRFKYCYHCGTDQHIKSGGCWTAKRAKKGVWHVI